MNQHRCENMEHQWVVIGGETREPCSEVGWSHSSDQRYRLEQLRSMQFVDMFNGHVYQHVGHSYRKETCEHIHNCRWILASQMEPKEQTFICECTRWRRSYLGQSEREHSCRVHRKSSLQNPQSGLVSTEGSVFRYCKQRSEVLELPFPKVTEGMFQSELPSVESEIHTIWKRTRHRACVTATS